MVYTNNGLPLSHPKERNFAICNNMGGLGGYYVTPSHPSGSSQCTSPEHPVSCIEPGLAIHFTYDNLHVSMPFSHIIPPSPPPTESKRLFYTICVSFAILHTGYRYHLSKFHIYALVYCIGVFQKIILELCQAVSF